MSFLYLSVVINMLFLVDFIIYIAGQELHTYVNLMLCQLISCDPSYCLSATYVNLLACSFNIHLFYILFTTNIPGSGQYIVPVSI